MYTDLADFSDIFTYDNNNFFLLLEGGGGERERGFLGEKLPPLEPPR